MPYQIAQDKQTHIIAGTLVTLLFLPFGWQIAAGACLLVAVLREAHNLATGGKWDWQDIAATAAGGLVIVVASALGSAGAMT